MERRGGAEVFGGKFPVTFSGGGGSEAISGSVGISERIETGTTRRRTTTGGGCGCRREVRGIICGI